LLVDQHETGHRVGFVRRGTAVTFKSAGPVFCSVQARGEAYFSLAFPIDARPVSRILDRPGEVELASGAGHFWMRAHLFVSEHPYFTRTDAQGRFTLERVTPGELEVVCWHPDWHEAEHERDADTGLICRMTYKPPVTLRNAVYLTPGATQEVCFRLNKGLFGR
jgi:hypothetical protein